MTMNGHRFSTAICFTSSQIRTASWAPSSDAMRLTESRTTADGSQRCITLFVSL